MIMKNKIIILILKMNSLGQQNTLSSDERVRGHEAFLHHSDQKRYACKIRLWKLQIAVIKYEVTPQRIEPACRTFKNRNCLWKDNSRIILDFLCSILALSLSRVIVLIWVEKYLFKIQEFHFSSQNKYQCKQQLERDHSMSNKLSRPNSTSPFRRILSSCQNSLINAIMHLNIDKSRSPCTL